MFRDHYFKKQIRSDELYKMRTINFFRILSCRVAWRWTWDMVTRVFNNSCRNWGWWCLVRVSTLISHILPIVEVFAIAAHPFKFQNSQITSIIHAWWRYSMRNFATWMHSKRITTRYHRSGCHTINAALNTHTFQRSQVNEQIMAERVHMAKLTKDKSSQWLSAIKVVP